MNVTQLYGTSEADVARALIGGDVIADVRNDLLKQVLVAVANKASGGGGTGDVVGPAASTDGAVVLWDGLTGKLLKDSSSFITGGGTVALGGFTLTVPATGTAALLDAANNFTSNNIFSVNGAANASALKFTGSIFTGGDGTTTTPKVLFTDGSYDVTNWSTSGTWMGFVNTGFGGTYLQANNGPSSVLWYIDANTFGIRATGSNFHTRLDSSGMTMNSEARIGWTSGNGEAAQDVILYRDAAGILANRNGANAQTYRVYGTYTNSSNYERLSFITAAGAYSIKPEAAGTGTLRTLEISGLPTSSAGLASGTLWNNLGIVNVA